MNKMKRATRQSVHFILGTADLNETTNPYTAKKTKARYFKLMAHSPKKLKQSLASKSKLVTQRTILPALRLTNKNFLRFINELIDFP